MAWAGSCFKGLRNLVFFRHSYQLRLSKHVGQCQWTRAACPPRRRYCARPSEPIGRFPIPYKKDLPYDIVELMEEVETKGGFLPNVFKVLSHRPAEFRAFFAYYNALMNNETGRLSKEDKELIVVATSINNRCLYCVVAHSALHRIYSKNPTLADQVAVNYEVAELQARERAMLDFALAVSRCDTITEEHFRNLETHGFDREAAWDIAAIAAFFAMSNRIAHVTDMRPNKEFYSLGRIPRDKDKDKESEK
ncbi:uncharacterized protein LOC136766782 [Amia ocellicauda]|uniref:uncharacterized protein LOC136766782 n=1 Tax=Amia ocellicauda TaxID=2972642 RepID=UPI003464B720